MPPSRDYSGSRESEREEGGGGREIERERQEEEEDRVVTGLVVLGFEF